MRKRKRFKKEKNPESKESLIAMRQWMKEKKPFPVPVPVRSSVPVGSLASPTPGWWPSIRPMERRSNPRGKKRPI